MRPWQNRSIEEANLLNPAFLSVLTHECVKGFVDSGNGNAPYILPFLVLPLVLHKRTRLSFPSTTRTIFASWITKREGTQAKAGYVERAKSLNPYIKEALLFSLANGILIINERGGLELGRQKKDLAQDGASFTSEVAECITRASFCGKWFSRIGKIETAMALLGVKP